MSLSRERTFELWVPETSPWSVWAKPVLFSYLPDLTHGRARLDALPAPGDVSSWAPSADGTTLLVVDLPGVRSVQLGEALVFVGFRPVPLFNAVPGPLEDATAALASRPSALVEVHSILDAIQQVSTRSIAPLAALRDDAPPAFLLDAERRVGRAPRPGDFDNRSISLPTDFPSASFLQSRAVSNVLLVTDDEPASDLAHTLLRWQNAGLGIRSCAVGEGFEAAAARTIEVARPSRFGAIWHNALSMLGLRRNPLGGFGGTLPVPSSG